MASTLAVTGCRTPAPTSPVARGPAATITPPAPPGGRPAVALDRDATDGKLELRFAPRSAPPKQGAIQPLPDADAQAMLAKLEPLPVDTAPAPALRPASAAPPVSGAAPQPIAFTGPTGTAITESPIAAPPPPPPPPPEPLPPPSITPTGDIRLESEVRVTFDQAMVPVAAVGTIATPAITIAPPVIGAWRWIDTRVASFAIAAPRFAAATTYTVTVAAGARALNGSILPAAATATFTTPPPMIAGVFPTTTLRPDSPLAIQFDQTVDAAVVAKHLRVVDRGRTIPIERITLAEAETRWAKHPTLGYESKLLGASYVIVAPKLAWPAASEPHVVLGVGTPSAEGPRLTTAETDATFTVAAPFTALGIVCEGVEQPRLTGAVCAAKGAVSVELSNPATFDARQIQIEGQPYDHNSPIGLTAPTTVGRTFTIAITGPLVDSYGQAFTGPRRLAFTTAPEHFTPTFYAPSGLFVLDPRFEIPQWIVNVQAIAAVRVQLYAVQPADYFAFLAYERGKRSAPPGKRVYDHQDAVGARFGATTRVDLRPALSAAGTGHVIAIASSTSGRERATAWIQVSKLGITARTDRDKLSAWIHRITPAKALDPVAGVATSLLVDGRRDSVPAVSSDAQGHAAFELMPRQGSGDGRTAVLLAATADDSVFAAIDSHERAIRTHHAHWYVTDDRFTYKPGEPVYVKGWVRWTHDGVNPVLALPTETELAWSLVDSRSVKLASGKAALTAQGGFDLEVKLPANTNLGTAHFTFETKGETEMHGISVEEFRTPAFAVDLDDDVGRAGTPLIAGEAIEMATTAKYYAGGGLAGARVRWNATLMAASYHPPGWEAFSFAPVRTLDEPYRRYRPSIRKSETGALDGASVNSLVIGIAAVPGSQPAVLEVESSVTDLDRQTIRATSRPILVHPSAYYVGVHQKAGAPGTLEVVVTGIDGEAITGVPVEVSIEGVVAADRYADKPPATVDLQRCKLTSTREPAECTFVPRDRKVAYTAIARVIDRRGRPNATQFQVPWWAPPEHTEELTVTSDKPEYQIGDVAKLEIRSVQVPAIAVVSIARNGMLSQQRVDLVATSTTVELPIEPTFVKNVHVVVDRWTKEALPRHRSIERELRVDIESARLDIKARATRAVVQPGDDATFEVEVRHHGKPVAGAEVALFAVDEAVLALSERTHADPLAPFYFEVVAGTAELSSLDLVHDSGPDLAGNPGFERWSLDEPGRRYGVGSGSGGMRGRTASVPSVRIGSPSVQKTRKDFRATAVWSPRLATDARGRATVTVKMPDSLTRFRIVALATATTRNFGKAESTIITQRKLNARTVAPRFLTQGDAFALPVIVQNLDGVPRTIDVAVRASNLVATGPVGKRVTVGAGERAEVRFDFVTKARGKVAIQTAVRAGDLVDATTIELPVYEPATTESFAMYGSVDDTPHHEQLAVPAGLLPDVGGVEVELASTQLQSLTDAFWYLQGYPHECAEQRSSRMLATTALADLLESFASPNRPTKAQLAATSTADLATLANDQLAGGGWGYFRGMEADPFVSMQVLAALGAHASRSATTKRAIAYVTAETTTRLAVLERLAKTPLVDRKAADRSAAPYSVSLVSVGLVALAANKVDVRARAERLHTVATTLAAYPVDAKARVLGLVAQIDRYKPMRAKLLAELTNASRETAGAATITTAFVEAERLLLVSNTKTTALALEAILREQPTHALVPKLARGLLAARKRGRWASTQENLVVVQAMRRYFDVYEKETPSFTGKLWFGSVAYAEQAFAGRSTATHAQVLPWSLAPARSTHAIALQKTGAGRMYYRLGITYATADRAPPALDAGFIVRREYAAADDPADLVRTPTGYRVKLGAKLVVTVETLNTTNRFAVAVVDQLPAGFESVNTRLRTSERSASGALDSAWDHTNMRDNRAEAFMMSLAPGSHRFSYTVRATTPGTFIAAPAKAEEMYSPETFGRSSGTSVVIE
ncbi:MAG: alpha-2-macroglobulin family protein [Kofleriaceae bacterium]